MEDSDILKQRDWYEPIARQWITAQAQSLHQLRLIVDGTKVGFGSQLLIVSLAYRQRAIPLAWAWVRQVRGHTTPARQLSLLGYLHSLLPKGTAVLLVADSEFSSVTVLRQLEAWRWDYVVRQKGRVKICMEAGNSWQPFSSFVQCAGESHWLGAGYLTEKHIYPVNLLIHWQKGKDEPWCLATNLPDQNLTLQAFARRMWTEEMFGDLKRHGFDLESTMLRHTQRMSRLTLAVVLLYVWRLAMSTRTVCNGERHWVDHNDRRDLSIFQIGLRFLERQLINDLSIQTLLCCYR